MSKTEEIEHKYLVTGLVTMDMVLKREKMEVKYGPDDTRARRITDMKTGEMYYEGVIKSPTGFGKAMEEDMKNPEMVFKTMDGDVHEKVRSYIRDGSTLIVVDTFQSGPNGGFMLAEIEKAPGQPWPPKALPDWLGKDVTGDPRFFSKNIFTTKLSSPIGAVVIQEGYSEKHGDTVTLANRQPEQPESLINESCHNRLLRQEEVSSMMNNGPKAMPSPPEYVIRVYLDDGRVAEYSVESEASVREHASAIVKDGYRHNDGQVFEHYPPHRIMKVKCVGSIHTKYPSVWSGT